MNSEKQQRAAASDFARRWEGRGYEKGESQLFWTELLTEVFGVTNPSAVIRFEQQARLDHTSFIDAMLPDTHVMIEQKSLGKNLRQPIRQSDGSLLTPFQQAQRYSAVLPYSERPRWIVTCNFSEFDVYDMENPKGEPSHIMLKDLEREYYRLHFLIQQQNLHLQREMEVSMKAGEIVGRIYDALITQYDADDAESLRYLNILCVRLVFCLYAEDAGIFGRHDQFHDYLSHYTTDNMRTALVQLFDVLNTPKEHRSRYLEPELAAFPYTNGGLFAEKIDIPQFTDELREALLQHASLDFDWSEISPTIFGGVFESTLNPETRRSGGMHYTSIENIHKVIDPLFLDSLKAEFADCREETNLKKRLQRLHALQDRMAQLHFFDPACGSGNFLTETYLSLRRLENDIIKLIYNAEQLDAFTNPIKVSIHQFYGIEINDFAVTVATTALWISEAQMMAETERIIHHDIDFLPLKSYANICEGNSLRIDWETVCPKAQLDYIIGNPPFVGARMMSESQKADVLDIFGKIKDVQDLDYVCCWFKKATQMMDGTKTETALVATNSISQGSQVPILWNVLFKDYHVTINFAYPTFKWTSESNNRAAVHCVIIGFSQVSRKRKSLYYSTPNAKDNRHDVSNISPYLVEGENVTVAARNKSICDVPKMCFGNQPRDGGHFVINAEEREEILKKADGAEKWLRPYIGAEEFINGKKRWCIWLRHASPSDIRKSPTLYRKVQAVLAMRLASTAKTTNGYAKVPHLFAQMTQPEGEDYIIIPRVSSERRRYIPMGYMKADIVSSDAVQIIPSATLYHFGILESNVHMAWMRAVCGRLKSDYRYSKDIVYNNFPWPDPTEEQKAKIEQTAQAILDARALYPDSSLANLYDPTLMPPALLNAHHQNDRAVMQAYGFNTRMTESECVAQLFALYQHMAK